MTAAVVDFDLVTQLVTAGALGTLIGMLVPNPLTPSIERRAGEGCLFCAVITSLLLLGADSSSAAVGITPVLGGVGALLLYLLLANLAASVLGRRRRS